MEPVGEPAEPDNGAYSALKQAIETAPDGKETTVTLTGDIAGMTTEQIITWTWRATVLPWRRALQAGRL